MILHYFSIPERFSVYVPLDLKERLKAPLFSRDKFLYQSRFYLAL
jgi:hypothetical protein